MISLPTESGPLCVPLEKRRSRRSKYIRAWVDEEHRVILSVPWHTSYREGLAFIQNHGDWLADQLNRIPPRKRLFDFLQEQKQVSIRGESWALQLQFTPSRSRYSLEDDSSQVILHVNPKAETETVLFRVIRDLAKQVLTERTHALAKKVGQEPIKVVVRNQRSRWGSCSGRREISLNWRLLFLPPSLQDYVVLHELAHLQEMHHGAAFWALLRSYDPQARRHDQMLHKAGKELMSIGRNL